MTPLYRLTFDAPTLLHTHPPHFYDSHKTLLFRLAYPDHTAPPGTLTVTRWPPLTPDVVDLSHPLTTTLSPDFYTYPPTPPGSVDWHVNFADPNLFYAYGTSLFAQDEMQVAEHPLLASVREALVAQNLPAKTTDHTGPTPILITNVPRHLEVDTYPTPANPRGLYGNRFADASAQTLRQATRIINPPTTTHLLAIAAPAGRQGPYTPQDLTHIFTTAYTAFSAAKQESPPLSNNPHARITLHAGFWGCGAFGGNRPLMTALQSLAARAAHLDHLTFHTGSQSATPDAQGGLTLAHSLAQTLPTPCPLPTLITHLASLNYRWGTSDGN